MNSKLAKRIRRALSQTATFREPTMVVAHTGRTIMIPSAVPGLPPTPFKYPDQLRHAPGTLRSTYQQIKKEFGAKRALSSGPTITARNPQ